MKQAERAIKTMSAGQEQVTGEPSRPSGDKSGGSYEPNQRKLPS